MAKVVRGKKEVEIEGFGDNYIITEDEPRDPTSLEFTDEEIERLKTDQTAQFLFARYRLEGNRLRKRA